MLGQPWLSKPIELSSCCKAPMIVSHGCDSDFDHNGKPCNCTDGTMWNECSKCKKPCDIAMLEDKILSLCSHCYCMTYTLDGNCGKCKQSVKSSPTVTQSVDRTVEVMKQQRKDEAYKAYEAIQGPAWEAYKAKIKEIDGEDIKIIDGKRYKLIEE